MVKPDGPPGEVVREGQHLTFSLAKEAYGIGILKIKERDNVQYYDPRKKIGTGFGLLILLAMVMGGTAVWNMLQVGTESKKRVNEHVPEVDRANAVVDLGNAVRVGPFQGPGHPGYRGREAGHGQDPRD